MSEWRFALPPSLGREPVRARARELAALLSDAGFATVWPQESYTSLLSSLLAGEAHAAWGPPLACARVEAEGGVVALRGIRHGATTYRSVLIARVEDRLDLEKLPSLPRRPRAVWVDERSMAGYLMPRAWFREKGLVPEAILREQRFLGSYVACLEAVLEGDADVTACFAPSPASSRPAAGLVDLIGFRATDLRVLVTTGECPNDGVVLSPLLDAAAREGVKTALARLVADPRLRKPMGDLFDVEGFDVPPVGAYRSLLPLLDPANVTDDTPESRP